MAAVSAAFALIGLVTGQVHLRGILAWCLATVLLYPFVAVFLFRAGMASPTVRAAGRRAGMYAGGATAVCVVACILLANLLPGRHGEWSLAALVPHPMAAFLGPYVLHAALLGRNADRAIAFGAASTFFAFLYFLVALRLWQSLPPALDRAFHAAEDGG
jgi:hypothetical protein